MAAGDTLTAESRNQLAGFSNASNSKFKVPSTKKQQKDDTVNAQPEDLIKNEDTFLTEGFAEHPKIPEVKTEPADFYRFGNNAIRAAEGGNELDVGAIQSKQLDDFGEGNTRGQDSLASIRLLGPANSRTKERRDLIPKFTKFMLQSVQEAHVERHQVVETFGEFFTFFYGERPPIYNFSGTMVNSKIHNWLSDFMFYYENFLRGTRAVENNATIVLTYGGRQIEGFILNTSNNTQAVTDKGVGITFQVLVIDRKILSLSADFGLTISDGRFAQDEAFLKTLTESGLARAEVSTAFNAVKQTVSQINGAADGNKVQASDASLDAEFAELGGTIPSASGGRKLILSA